MKKNYGPVPLKRGYKKTIKPETNVMPPRSVPAICERCGDYEHECTCQPGLACPAELTKVNISDADKKDALDAAMLYTLSPCEHVWTEAQQRAMAHYCLWACQRLYVIERTAKGERWV